MRFLKCMFVVIEKHFGSIIIAIAIIAAALIYANFNPYQICKRDLGLRESTAAYICSGSN